MEGGKDHARSEGAFVRDLARRARAAVLPTLIPLLLLGVFVYSAIAFALPEEKTTDIDRYAPLTPGVTWIYDSSTTTGDGAPEAGTLVSRVLADTQILASSLAESARGIEPTIKATAIHQSWTNFFGRPHSSIQYVRKQGDAFEQLARRDGAGDLAANDPPLTTLRGPLEPGESWSYEGVLGSSETTSETVVEEVTNLTVAGETIEDCVRTVEEASWVDSSNARQRSTATSWLCPDIGVVRQSEVSPTLDVEISLELTFFTSADKTIGEARSSAPVVPSGGTLGIDLGHAGYAEGDPDTERLAWSISRQTSVYHAPVGGRGTVLLSEADGWLTMIDLSTGGELWAQRLHDPIVTPPVIAGDVVFVADSRRRLLALDAGTGASRWIEGLTDIAASAPTLAGDHVIVPTQDGLVAAFGLDGQPAWEIELGDVVWYPPAASEDAAIIGSGSDLLAVDGSSSDEIWKVDLGGEIASSPVVTGNHVLATDEGGEVALLDMTDGSEIWNHAIGSLASVYDSPATDGESVYYWYETGAGHIYAEALDIDDGHRTWKVRLEGEPVGSAVVTDGSMALVRTDASILVLDKETGEMSASRSLTTVQPETDPSAPYGLSLVDGALVATIRGGDLASVTGYVAIPTGGSGESAPYLASEPRPSFEVTRTELHQLGEEVVFGGLEGVIGVAPGGETRTIAQTEDIPAYAAVGGGRLLVHAGNSVTAYSSAGDELWSTEIGGGVLGRPAAVSENTVAAADDSGNLYYLDARSGRILWRAPAEGVSIAPPLLLPDGDVIYMSGGLKRYDGSSGRTEWAKPGWETFNPMATDGGMVFAYAFPNTVSPGGIHAFDIDSGEELWKVEPFNSPLLTGMAAGDGVVVTSDITSVIGYEADSGRELWRVPIGTPLGGDPVIAGDVAMFVESDRLEDINAHGFRVRVHDLRTGRFLGDYEPHGGIIVNNTVGAAPKGVILPSSSLIEIVRPQPW